MDLTSRERNSAAYVKKAEEKNCPPSECLVDTHLYFHFKNGVWTNKRAQQVMEEVKRKVAELPQPVSNEDKNKIYLKVNRKNKKRRIVGEGNLSQYHVVSSRPQHPFMTQPIDVSSNPTIVKMQEEIDRRRGNDERLTSELAELRQVVRGLAKHVSTRQMGIEMGSPTHAHSEPTQ